MGFCVCVFGGVLICDNGLCLQILSLLLDRSVNPDLVNRHKQVSCSILVCILSLLLGKLQSFCFNCKN